MSNQPIILHQIRSLTLRRTIPDDAEFLFDKMYSNYEFMRLFRLNDLAENVTQVREKLVRRWQGTPAQSGYLECMLVHQKHGPIGIVAAADYSRKHQRAELLIGIFDEQYRSASHAIFGVGMMLDLVFNAYNLHRFYAYCYHYNQESQKCLKSAGFKLEGIMKEHLFDPVLQQYVDLHIYGMTVNQFRQNALIRRLSKHIIKRDMTQPLVAPVPPPSDLPSYSSPKHTFVKSGSISLG